MKQLIIQDNITKGLDFYLVEYNYKGLDGSHKDILYKVPKIGRKGVFRAEFAFKFDIQTKMFRKYKLKFKDIYESIQNADIPDRYKFKVVEIKKPFKKAKDLIGITDMKRNIRLFKYSLKESSIPLLMGEIDYSITLMLKEMNSGIFSDSKSFKDSVEDLYSRTMNSLYGEQEP